MQRTLEHEVRLAKEDAKNSKHLLAKAEHELKEKSRSVAPLCDVAELTVDSLGLQAVLAIRSTFVARPSKVRN